ncbi:MAG TPA: DUF5060 domain-containing protein [Bryobacteraceae bacterium]|nr:DUF5060 domain-containing protein [Bryobacteraceae bacterium]
MFSLRTGLLSVSALIVLPVLIHAQPCGHTPAWSPCELVVELSDQAAAKHPNPYQTVEMRADFRSTDLRAMSVPAYWDGEKRMVLRFAPSRAGEWQYRIDSNVADLDGKTGTFTATESESPGFIQAANLHHWAYTAHSGPLTQAHLWMGADEPRLATMDDALFRSMADERAAAKFTHVRGMVLGEGGDAGFGANGLPDLSYFHRLDERVRYLNQKGMAADLTIAPNSAALLKRFPTPAVRKRLISFLVGRYAGMNVTWEPLATFEDYPDSRALQKELGGYIREMDGYHHPRTAGAKVTSAPLLDDGWMDFTSYGTPDVAVGAIEHQLYQVPAVNRLTDTDPVQLRHRLWESTMNGQYPESASAGSAAAAKTMSVWFDFMNGTRHWDVEPYFDVDGGRALARPGVEYIVYIEKPGPVELTVDHHGYEVFWVDPADGTTTKGKYSGEHFTGEPPDRYHDWVLHVVREGTLASMNRSYKFESWEIPVQEIVINPEKIPYDIDKPTGDLKVGQTADFSAKLKRQTRGTRTMLWMWTGEATAEGQGYRVLGTGQQGSFTPPPGLATSFPTDLLVRLYGINGYGTVYMLAKGYTLQQ